jgi:D-beta-D-heptose 7-phosphate kinase / D-beta-D-heptose 1-phosphate adenosyltransferase
VSRAPLLVVGDVLLDRDLEGRVERLCPDAPVPVVDRTSQQARPGGAGLAALLAARDGREVTLVTALAADAGGAELRLLLEAAGVEVLDLGLGGETAEKLRVRSGGHVLLRIDAGAAAAGVGPPAREVREALAGARALLVADYGRGVTAEPSLRDLLADPASARPLVWDPHPRGSRPVAGVRLATPNRAEAARLVPAVEGDGLAASGQRARALVRRWKAAGVAVTLGAEGALLALRGGEPLVLPAERIAHGDPCGAGDRFAATAAGLLADGELLEDAVGGAVREATAFVAAGGAGSIALEPPPAATLAPVGAEAVIARTRARGGTVVATGGCFDLLHAGHVASLRAARALGDCLVVCLNSDASVRRLKGPDRPLVPEDDRAAVLEALECVDAVAVFEEDTPVPLLERLRPDIFAKGGDYVGADLPEAAILRRWGGQTVVLPYLEGRSTTRLIQEATLRVAP